MAPILHFIEGGDSHRCALIDNALVTLTVNNGWEGIIIYGYIRDTAIITKLPIGIRTLNTHPQQSHKSHEDPLKIFNLTSIN